LIKIYDRNLIPLGEIVNYTSIQFGESQYDAAPFEIHVNAAIEGAEELAKNRIILIDDDPEKAGLITDYNRADDDQDMIVIKGYELKIITRQRETLAPEGKEYATYHGTVETVMRNILLDNFIKPTDSARIYPFLTLTELKGIGEKITIQSTNKNVYDLLVELAQSYNVGWRIIPNFATSTYDFVIYESEDRSGEVFFEDESGSNNILSAEYTDSVENFRNVAYVFGEGEGAERKRVSIGNARGWDRHEVTIDARDIQSETDEDTTLSDAEYEALLRQRGNEKLTEYAAEEFLDIKTLSDVQSPYQYKRDYFLGNKVQIMHHRWGLSKVDQITKVTHIWESSGYRLEQTFGAEKPTIKNIFKNIDSRLSTLENSN